MKALTIVLEDHGQDFLEWDVRWDDGVRHPYAPVEAAYEVIACRPCQEWYWKGTRVHNTDIKPGDTLHITLKGVAWKVPLQYPVEKVRTA